jgi:choline dehydrogenase-like flavoprotein
VILESWFNPVVTQSLFMPGWFDEHRENMRRYRHMTCLGVVTGTESNGRVKPGLTRAGVNLDYRPTDADFARIKRGVKLACEIGLKLGARRVMPTTMHGLELKSLSDLPRIDAEIRDTAELLVNSAHPQGGNALGRNGVVDERFQVHGVPGLYVCDASVFPSSITVNPQLTVMALAAYAAEQITGRRRAPAAPPGRGSPLPA